MLALVLLTASAVANDPSPRFEVVNRVPSSFVVVNRVPPVTTHTYVYPTTTGPGYGVGTAWTEQGGVFTAYGDCAGGSCAAPGRVLTGIGAARGFAGYSGGGRVFGGIFRRR